MIEFDDKDLRDLQEVHGIVLQDVHGQRVAIGDGFDYGDVFEFMSGYFEEYGVDDFAKQLGYEDSAGMLKAWFSGTSVNEDDLTDSIYKAFDGIDAGSLPDNYDHKEEAYLEAEDHKLDRERGK